MHKIVTDIDINASPAVIWSILTDFSSYAEWNPFFRKVSGRAAKGDRLIVTATPPNGRALTFRPLVLECIENRELCWRGRVLLPGLFDGTRFFRIEAMNTGRSRFIHGEHFAGILVLPLKPYLEGKIHAGMLEMNRALKSRAEHQ